MDKNETSPAVEIVERVAAARIIGTLGFFASVIKSGEPWTPTCQRAYDDAKEAAILTDKLRDTGREGDLALMTRALERLKLLRNDPTLEGMERQANGLTYIIEDLEKRLAQPAPSAPQDVLRKALAEAALRFAEIAATAPNSKCAEIARNGIAALAQPPSASASTRSLDPLTLEAAAKVARETGAVHADGWRNSGPPEAATAASNAAYFIEKAIRSLSSSQVTSPGHTDLMVTPESLDKYLEENSPDGRRVEIEHDGFIGTIQGHYVTREGKRGVVLQQIGTKVVHVYGEKWIK